MLVLSEGRLVWKHEAKQSKEILMGRKEALAIEIKITHYVFAYLHSFSFAFLAPSYILVIVIDRDCSDQTPSRSALHFIRARTCRITNKMVPSTEVAKIGRASDE